ncbi:hypothetical protein PIB30_079793 [Stylosanthes scabra]|uniref:DUF4283 domain-containing protein n=1 Tax=Stylosanthes scabra TaxID=79078 RepID=A0ABU6SRX1_9FABA|nr:hypothetical protein [Stylosanthes scabra]
MEEPLATNSVEEQNAKVSNEEEEDLFVYEERDIAEGVKKCKDSIVGKLITEKNINPNWIHNAMYNIWRKPEGFQLKEVQDKLYQFFFEKESDMKRVLKGSPWIFRNSWLIMEKWERNTNPKKMDFSKDEVSVQIWNLPEHCKTTKLGIKLAAVIGEVLECNLYDCGNEQGMFIKARFSNMRSSLLFATTVDSSVMRKALVQKRKMKRQEAELNPEIWEPAET